MMRVDIYTGMVLLAAFGRSVRACYGNYVNDCFEVTGPGVNCDTYYMPGTNFGYITCANGTSGCKAGGTCDISFCTGTAAPGNSCVQVELDNTTKCSDYYQQYAERGGGQCMDWTMGPADCKPDPMSICAIDPSWCSGVEAPGGDCKLLDLKNATECSGYFGRSSYSEGVYCMATPSGPSSCVTDDEKSCDIQNQLKASHTSIFTKSTAKRSAQVGSLRVGLN